MALHALHNPLNSIESWKRLALSLELVEGRTKAAALCTGVSASVGSPEHGRLRRLTMALIAPFGPSVSFVVVDQ
jgi:hypothetical protein